VAPTHRDPSGPQRRCKSSSSGIKKITYKRSGCAGKDFRSSIPFDKPLQKRWWLASVSHRFEGWDRTVYGNGTFIEHKVGTVVRSGTTTAIIGFAGVPGTTYTATGTRSATISYLDEDYSDTLNPTDFYYAYNFSSFESPVETYPDTYDWFGPGPPEGWTTSSVQTGNTTATKNYTKATISLAFTGLKNTTDNLKFSAGNSGICSEILGILFCPNIGYLEWNLEVTAAVSDDASKWTIKQQFVSGTVSGNTIDATGTLHTFSQPQVATEDDPSSTFVQNTSGTKNIFWLDSPGVTNTANSGQPIDSMTFIQNFSGQVCSTVLTTICSPTVTWYVKIIITPGGHLDTTNSTAALGTATF
jgi:hypothetical protein